MSIEGTTTIVFDYRDRDTQYGDSVNCSFHNPGVSKGTYFEIVSVSFPNLEQNVIGGINTFFNFQITGPLGPGLQWIRNFPITLNVSTGERHSYSLTHLLEELNRKINVILLADKLNPPGLAPYYYQNLPSSIYLERSRFVETLQLVIVYDVPSTLPLTQVNYLLDFRINAGGAEIYNPLNTSLQFNFHSYVQPNYSSNLEKSDSAISGQNIYVASAPQVFRTSRNYHLYSHQISRLNAIVGRPMAYIYTLPLGNSDFGETVLIENKKLFKWDVLNTSNHIDFSLRDSQNNLLHNTSESYGLHIVARVYKTKEITLQHS